MNLYYIGKDLASVRPDELSPGERIICLVTNGGYFTSDYMNGPYRSIDELKKNSSIFKTLSIRDQSRTQKILDERNILKCSFRKQILTNRGDTSTKDFIKTFEHIVGGEIKSKRLLGIHFFDKEKMKINTVTGTKDINSVWKAKSPFKFYLIIILWMQF